MSLSCWFVGSAFTSNGIPGIPKILIVETEETTVAK
jgi:hypothetical protein